jgi:hypothetical protein
MNSRCLPLIPEGKVKSIPGVLLGVHIFGVFANGMITQIMEDPYGCRKECSSVFFRPWSPK